MDTNRLRYFCVIAETGSLTKASDILNVSHSGLSKAVSVLQEETKLQLFRPQGRGLEITEEGKWLYQKAREILAIENEISLGAKVENTSLRLGLSEVIAITCSGALAKEFTGPLTLLETDIGEVEGRLISGEIDFGVAFSLSPKPELEYLELGEVKFNSYAGADLIENKTPAELPFAVPSSNFPFNPMGYKARDGWPQEIPRLTRFAVSRFSMALELLKAGEAAVYMPNFVATLENVKMLEKTQIIKVPQHKQAETRRKLFLVKTKTSEETKDMKKTSKILRKICCT